MTPRLFWQVLCGGAWLNGRAQRCCAPDSSWRAPRIWQIPCCVDNAAEAVAVIREHHARWLAAQGKSSYPRAPRALVGCAGQELLRCGLRQWGCAGRPPLGLAGEIRADRFRKHANANLELR